VTAAIHLNQTCQDAANETQAMKQQKKFHLVFSAPVARKLTAGLVGAPQ
jgi:hypothetical protein